MERIGVRELRQNASRYLARVRAGETVEVTDRGELVAVLVPPPRGETARDRLIAEGRLSPPADPDGRRRLPTPVPMSPGEPTAEDVIAESREDRL